MSKCIYYKYNTCCNIYKCKGGYSYFEDGVKLCKLGGNLAGIKQAIYTGAAGVFTYTHRDKINGIDNEFVLGGF